jgi:succinate dehydrogenase / fumarate reductase cytochrome b subunit
MSTAVPSKRRVRPNSPAAGEELRPWLWRRLRSSVANKFFVALTGLGLSLFVLVHMAGNLSYFRGRDAINTYAAFLKSQGPLLWAARIGLLLLFVLHIALALRLRYRSRQARPIGYAAKENTQASFAARTMVLSGLVIFVFVLFHLAHYTFGVVKEVQPEPGRWVNYLDLKDKDRRHDVYAMMYYGFHDPLIAILYILAQLFLLLHLWHGIRSLFQSLGLNAPRTQHAVTLFSMLFALVVALGNIFIVTGVWVEMMPAPPTLPPAPKQLQPAPQKKLPAP